MVFHRPAAVGGQGHQRALLLGIINSGELLDKLRDDSPIGIAVDEGPDGSQGGTVLEMPPANEAQIALVKVLGLIAGVILLGIIVWGRGPVSAPQLPGGVRPPGGALCPSGGGAG